MAARKRPLKVAVTKTRPASKPKGENQAGRPRMAFPQATVDKVCNTIIDKLWSEKRTLENLGINPDIWRREKRLNPAMKKQIQEAKEDMLEDDLYDMVEIADSAFDRDSAAAAMAKIKARECRARMVARHLYGTPLDQQGGVRVGIIVLPPKNDGGNHAGALIDMKTNEPLPLEQPERLARR